MTLTESSLLCNRRGNFIDSILRQGNIIPHLWYHKILKNGGKPDTVSIIVLADLAKLYCECSGASREFQISYSDLRSKFNYTKRQLYPAIKRLEQRGLITRAERSKEIEGKNFGNFLYLTLNIDALLALSDCNNSSGNNSNYDSGNNFKFKETALQNNVDIIDEISSIPYIDNNNLVINNNRLLVNSRLAKDKLLGKNGLTEHTLAEDISLVNDKSSVNKGFKGKFKSSNLNLTSESSFSKSNLNNLKSQPSISGSASTTFSTNLVSESNIKSHSGNHCRAKVTALAVFANTASKSSRKVIKKSLAGFHPLNEDDAEFLRISSGREFNLNFVNQLLLKLAQMKPDHGFASKRMFISYMSKALKYELRQATVANNEGYILRCNKDKVESSIDSYLSCVESNNATTRFEKLRRKIACVFAPSTAYALLTKAKFFERAGEGIFRITIEDITTLTEHSKEMLLNEVRATYGNHITALVINEGKVSHSGESNITPISQSSQLSELETEASTLGLDTTGSTNSANVTNIADVKSNVTKDAGSYGIWATLRKSLKDYYGEGVDRAWFSKLEVVESTSSTDITSNANNIDNSSNIDNTENLSQLVLKAPSNFLKNYVEQNYRHLMDRFCQTLSGGSLKLRLQTV